MTGLRRHSGLPRAALRSRLIAISSIKGISGKPPQASKDETSRNRVEFDPVLLFRYSARTLPKRAANKRAVEERFALDPEPGPLFCVVSRLTWQKGMDVLLEAADHLGPVVEVGLVAARVGGARDVARRRRESQ